MWGAALIVGCTALAYANSFTDTFVWDDRAHILDNENIRHLWPLSDLLRNSSRPAVHLSLALNYALGGLHPFGYHLGNLLIHVTAALLLYVLVSGTMRRETSQWTEPASVDGVALATALVWAVHPLQTQSVTYLIQRCESLMGLCYLFTVYAVLRGADARHSRPWYVAAVAATAVGIACKPVMVTAPLVVLLYDRCFLAGSFRGALRARWPLYGGLVATWALLPPLLVADRADWDATAGMVVEGASPLRYLLTQAEVILHYLRLAIWPSGLCIDYSWPLVRDVTTALPGLAIVGALLVITLYALWDRPALGFLGAWFFLILAPTSSIVPVKDAAMDHRMYLPLASVVLLATLGVHRALHRLGSRRPAWLPPVLVGLVVAGYVSATLDRNRDYRSEIAIWSSATRVRPWNARAHNNLGNSWFREGNFRRAEQSYARGVRIDPHDTEVRYNLGVSLVAEEKLDEAARQLEEVLRRDPDMGLAHFYLGHIRAKQDDLEAALEHARQAVALLPAMADAHVLLGGLLDVTGNVDQAIQHYQLAIERDPTEAGPLIALSWIRSTNHDPSTRSGADAVRLAERAVTLQRNPDAHELDVLAAAYAEDGRFEDAVAAASRALEMARTSGSAEMAAKIDERRQLYRRGQAYRTPPAAGQARSAGAEQARLGSEQARR